jgi:hypothetical protein
VASRAERSIVPGLGSAVRAAASDLYYNSWRLVPANLLWAVVVFVVAGLALVAPPLIVLVPLVALPFAGLFRMTTRIARGEAVSFWDGIEAWRHDVPATLGLGASLLVAAVVFGSNVVNGLLDGTPVGWVFAALAGWGLVGTWLYAWVAWPVLVDPVRAEQPVRQRLRLAALLVLAHPVRFGVLGLVLAVLLVASLIAIVALVVVSLAFAALVAARFVLPAADRLEARLALHAPPAAELPPESDGVALRTSSARLTAAGPRGCSPPGP